MEEKMLKISFSYTDEFGQESTTIKTLTTACLELDESTDFDILVDEFKLFLRASGFSEDLVNTIKIVEDLDSLN